MPKTSNHKDMVSYLYTLSENSHFDAGEKVILSEDKFGISNHPVMRITFHINHSAKWKMKVAWSKQLW